ncbi:DsrE family protein [Rhodohalobacter sp.]|uniref:DsrE family protein n=1 Tax=Rhodohalobacter sp. TaxID=1974210 RepID=UPI002ACEAA18|nr:DsrE family protein [Rhodohalobacter sp.]MDZ7757309.1 DsrE family protein [Rhodohalobacter sp.]
MKTLITFLITLLGFAGLAEAQSENDPLFVVLTSDDAETQMMAMVLATQSLNKDVPVRVLLCSDAGDLALKDSESPSFAPVDRSPKQLLMGLMNKGVQVDVCGIYLPNRDYTETDLMDGIGTAAPPEVAEFMKQEGVRYFTF